MDNSKDVITRFAPSPTGKLHIGSARTALFNYLFAKNQKGVFLLRLDDTDTIRSKKEHEKDILDSLSWMGINPDGPVTRQSEHGQIYKKHIKSLIDSGSAYVSNEREGDSRKVIRFRNPGTTVCFNDVVRGEITMETASLGDFVIAKNDSTPLYNLATVVDDIESSVTHIIRGEDGISNTPRQILIQEALGAKRPTYAHIALVLAPDRSKLSKRANVLSIMELADKGYLPSAIINFLALLGWNPKDNRELFSLEELIKNFSLNGLAHSGAIYDINKLNWFNRFYLQKMSDIGERIKAYFPKRSFINKDASHELITDLVLDRINVLPDISHELKKGGEFSFLAYRPQITVALLLDPKKSIPINEALRHFKYILEIFSKISEKDFLREDIIKDALWPYATEHGRGKVLWPMRTALTGKEKSPDPFSVARILGKAETIDRIKGAIVILQKT